MTESFAFWVGTCPQCGTDVRAFHRSPLDQDDRVVTGRVPMDALEENQNAAVGYAAEVVTHRYKGPCDLVLVAVPPGKAEAVQEFINLALNVEAT